MAAFGASNVEGFWIARAVVPTVLSLLAGLTEPDFTVIEVPVLAVTPRLCCMIATIPSFAVFRLHSSVPNTVSALLNTELQGKFLEMVSEPMYPIGMLNFTSTVPAVYEPNLAPVATIEASKTSVVYTLVLLRLDGEIATL